MWTDIYILSLYESPGDSTAQFVRMDVVYEGNMPNGMPDDWRPVLLQVASNVVVDSIDAAFSLLKTDDVIQFAYAPSTDQSVILVNDQPLIQHSGEGLYQAIKGMWFGDKPISKKIKQRILAGTCTV